jgi:hypothetical protein
VQRWDELRACLRRPPGLPRATSREGLTTFGPLILRIDYDLLSSHPRQITPSDMNIDSENLDYLTVECVPRMTLEGKRAKHRVHQRHFVNRQRERLEQLRRDLRCHTLQLLLLQAAKEATMWKRENATLRQELDLDWFLTKLATLSPQTFAHQNWRISLSGAVLSPTESEGIMADADESATG